MRRMAALSLLLSACAAHAEPEDPDPVQIDASPAEPVEATAQAELDAACQAVGPSLTNVLLDAAPNAADHVDEIAGRITRACLDRGRLEDAYCMLGARSLAAARHCAPDWALPWMGVPGCDAYLHDVSCLLDRMDSPQPQAHEAMIQVFDAWFTIPMRDLPEGTLNQACETAVDAIMDQPFADECAIGRASRVLTD